MPTVNEVFCSGRHFWWCSGMDKDDLILAVLTQALLLAHEVILSPGFAYTTWPAGIAF